LFLIFLHYDTRLLSGIDICPTVSFFIKKLTEILIPSFSKPQVPSVIRMKANGIKNKVFKPHVPIRCLNLEIIQSHVKLYKSSRKYEGKM